MKRLSNEECTNRFQKYGLELLENYINSRKLIKTKCKCGEIFYVLPTSVFSGLTTSCGCNYKKNGDAKRAKLIGQKFNKLTVLTYAYSKRISKNCSRAYWNCLCDCGNEAIFTTTQLRNSNTANIGCGTCNYFKNGIKTSRIQEILCSKVNGHSNYKIDKIVIDVALIKDKIAIEYDEWYWHGHKQEQDRKRLARLVYLGWKVLRIKSNRRLPSDEEINNALNLLKNTSRKQITITLPNWKKGDTFEILRQKRRVGTNCNRP